MAPTSKFRERAAKIAARFVQTVVLIDDEAFSYFRETGSGKVTKIDLVEPRMLPGDDLNLNQPKEGKPVESVADGARGVSGAAEGPKDHVVPIPSVETVLPAAEKPVVAAMETATDAEVEQGLNSRRLMANFARVGLVCGVIEPEPAAKDLNQLLVAAKRADVLIVDWVFNRDNGAMAQEIIRSVLATDASERLRLIVIYTGDPSIGKIVETLKSGAAKGLESTRENHVLMDRRTRIAVFSKVTSSKTKNAAVSIDELPKRVLIEFAALSAGLVTNAAMEGVAVIRNHTHQLLGRLHTKLDAPFLAHRMLLPCPEDSQEFLTDLVGQEIAALLQSHEIGNVSDMPAIEDWFEATRIKATKHSTELASALGLKEDQRIELVRLGTQALLNAKAPKDKHRALESLIHRNGSKIFLDENVKPDELDLEFAHVSSMVYRYAPTKQPRLTLGTVLAAQSGEYFVCIQPVCDCVRLNGPRRFAFLAAEKSSAPNLVVRSLAKHTKLRVLNKVAGLVQHAFAPTIGNDVVYAIEDKGESIFLSEEKRVFSWKGQLKFPQAQRLTQQFSALLARVGLDESEWLRRFERTADAEEFESATENNSPAKAAAVEGSGGEKKLDDAAKP